MTEPMSPEEHLAHLRDDIDRVLALPADAEGNEVANCPGWVVRDLLLHCAGVFRFAATQLRAEPGSSLQPFDPLPDDEPARALFEAEAAVLIDVLTFTDPDEHRPNWADAPTAEFYFRRMANELSIHRWDAQLATGTPEPVPTAQAVDGIEELCDIFLPHAGARGITGTGETVHLHATDSGELGGEWTFRFGPDGVTVERSHGKGDMAGRGTASDLVLFAWNRRPVSLETFGEPDLLTWWPVTVTI